jgi:DNA polymerase
VARAGEAPDHEKPAWSEQRACRPWLDEEIAIVAPRAIVLLGATAAQSLLGREFRVTKERGMLLDSGLAEIVLATIHPSAVLRADDREEAFEGLVADLRVAVSASRAG